MERSWDRIERLPPWVVGVLIATLHAISNQVWGSDPGSVRTALLCLVAGCVVWTPRVPLMVLHHRRVLRRYRSIEAELAARSGQH